MGFGFVEDPSVHELASFLPKIPLINTQVSNFNEYEVGGYERRRDAVRTMRKKIKTKRMKCRYIDENKKLGEVNWEPCC